MEWGRGCNVMGVAMSCTVLNYCRERRGRLSWLGVEVVLAMAGEVRGRSVWLG